jgi:hypothetical protein
VPVQELFDISNIVYIFLLYKIANSLRI